MILKATSEYRVVSLYLFWITTIFQTNVLFKTNKCHHGGPLGAEGQGQLPPLPPPLNPALPVATGLLQVCSWAFEKSACRALLSALCNDSAALIHISVTIHHKGESSYIWSCFTRKQISCHLRTFSPVNCNPKAFGWDDEKQRQDLEKPHELNCSFKHTLQP